jgi:hypothetical protein
MLDQVKQEDLDRLISITRSQHNAERKAYKVLVDFIERLPRPRVYVAGLTYTPDVARNLLWEMGYDILTAELAIAGKSVIDGETIGSLTIFSTVLESLEDMSDPLLPQLIWGRIIDEVYIPEDGENNSRHRSARKLAKRMGLVVCNWKPPSRIGARRV